VHALAHPSEGSGTAQEPGELLVGQLVEQGRQVASTLAADPDDHLSAGVSQRDPNDPPILVIAAPLDQAALLHAIHDSGRARLGDVERVGQGAHG